MVGGFVKDEEVGAGEHGAQQRHAHGFAAAELLGGCCGVEVPEAGLFERVLQACGQVPLVGDQIEIQWVDAAGIDARECIEDGFDAGERGDRFARESVDLLREIEHGAGADAAAGSRLQLSGQQAREHALADAVAADQASVLGVELLSEAGQQRRAVGKIEGCAVERQEWVRHKTSKDAGCSLLSREDGRTGRQ